MHLIVDKLMMLKHIPNALTIVRLLLVAPFLLCLSRHQFVYAFYVFIIAGFTDALDGRLAREFAWQSNFGAMVDPLADKILITASFVGLGVLHSLPWWLVILVLLRDVTISLGVVAWYFFIAKKPVLQPTYMSKINTVMQLCLVLVCLFTQAFKIDIALLQQILVGTVTLTTGASFMDYVWTWGQKACRQVT